MAALDSSDGAGTGIVPARDRLRGIDAARAVALVGMMATHILPLETATRALTPVGFLFEGRASALFAVLAGVGVALSTGGRRRPPDGRAHAGAGGALVVRAVLVALVGLVLADLDPVPLVILAYYGLMFVVAVPLLRLPPGVLGAAAVAWCAVSPVLSQLLRADVRYPTQVGLADLLHPVDLLTVLVVAGVYPVLTWTTYLLAGMAVGRLDLRRLDVALWLAVGGAVLTVAASVASAALLGPGGGAAGIGEAVAEPLYGTTPTSTWWWLAVDTPHSGTPLDLARTTGSALAVLGGALLLARVARPLLWVPAAIGGAPLTLYALHVVLTTAGTGDAATRGTVYLGHVVIVVIVGCGLRAAGLHGPLEAAVSAASRAARNLVDRRAPRPVGPAPPP